MAAPSPNRPADADLRRLYLDEKWTCQQIADQAGVRKITARRWLEAAGIPRRQSGSPTTLAARGIVAPTAAELADMVHLKHMSYAQIAKQYDVDPSAVSHWLRKHGIRSPTIWETRRKGHAPVMPSPEEAEARYKSGESLASIANSVGVDRSTVGKFMTGNGVTLRPDGWEGGKRYACQDGHEARSLYEQRVDDWLYEHGIPHELEPAYPWDRRYRADFKVGDTYIEVWGVTENDAYAKRRAMKIARCAEAGLPLIQINHWQFARGRKWWRPLLPLVRNTPQLSLPFPITESAHQSA